MIGLKSLIRRVRIKLIERIARGDNMALLSATRGLSIVALPMNGPTSAECLLLDRRINGLITVNAPVLCDLPNGRARVLIGAGAGGALRSYQ